MKIAILSDIHDNVNQLLSALISAKQAGCELLLFLGDLHSNSTLRTLREEWDAALHYVYGNNDFANEQTKRMTEAWDQTYCHGVAGELEIDRKRIFFTHYPELARQAEAKGVYDAIFYGHTHRAEQHLHHDCLIANPGELQGRSGHCSWAIYDTSLHRLVHIDN